AALVIEQPSDATLANALSGSGTLTKNGAGALTYTGNGAAFTGSTPLAAGTLAVDGTLGGALTAASGTTLAGTGTVGSTTLQNGATLSPAGAGVGTLNVNGDLGFAPGSTYRVDATPAGQNDLVRVS